MTLSWNREGKKRLLTAISVVWLISFYVLAKPHVDLWFTYLSVTPNTPCSEAFNKDDDRRTDCEYAVGAWADNSIRVQQGGSARFEPYWEKDGRPDLIWIWLGAPLLLLGLIRLIEWVIVGFKQSEK